MKLIDTTTNAEITLPNGLLWRDEFDWTPLVSSNSYTLAGALIIEQGVKQAGRPITLEAPSNDMGWVTRSTVEMLRAWSTMPAKTFMLTFEYQGDARQFTVAFDHTDDPINAEPVKGFPSHLSGDYFRVKLKFIEV